MYHGRKLLFFFTFTFTYSIYICIYIYMPVSGDGHQSIEMTCPMWGFRFRGWWGHSEGGAWLLREWIYIYIMFKWICLYIYVYIYYYSLYVCVLFFWYEFVAGCPSWIAQMVPRFQRDQLPTHGPWAATDQLRNGRRLLWGNLWCNVRKPWFLICQ